jgi:hypothetical protein
VTQPELVAFSPDNPKMHHFGTWMTGRPLQEKVEIFEDVAKGDELTGVALATLCDLEMNAALEKFKAPFSHLEDWFSLSEVTEHYRQHGDGNHDPRTFIGALVTMASTGVVIMRAAASAYRRDYIGTEIAFRVHWDNVLRYWDGALDRLFQPDGHVFLLSDGGHYIIGRARDVDTRVRELSSRSPLPVELEHAFPCEGSVEAQLTLHKMYTEYRTNDDWFVLPQEALAYIKGIRRMRGTYIEPFEDYVNPAHADVGDWRPGPPQVYKGHYVVEEGFAMRENLVATALPFTFATTSWDCEDKFWAEYTDAATKRKLFTVAPAVRVTDEYLDFPSAGDQRHVYPWREWERRKTRGLDMYD